MARTKQTEQRLGDLESLVEIALNRRFGVLATSSGQNTGVVLEFGTPETVVFNLFGVEVPAGTKVIIMTSVEYDASAGETSQTVSQEVVDQNGHVYDSIEATVAGGTSVVVSRIFQVDNPPTGDMAYSVKATVNAEGSPTITANNSSIVIQVVNN